MKYMIAWHERPQGSALEYENAQKRILGIFRHWEFPASMEVRHFVVRLGEWGGFMLVETSDPIAVQRLTSTFPAFEFRVSPVLEIKDAVDAELDAMAWRDALPLG